MRRGRKDPNLESQYLDQVEVEAGTALQICDADPLVDAVDSAQLGRAEYQRMEAVALETGP